MNELGVIDGPAGHGGKRPGAGRKKGYSPKQAASLFEPDGEVNETTNIAVDFAKARARKESALADLNELDYKVKSGEYIPRAAVQQASAELLAATAQSLRSLPDLLERKINVTPEIAEKVEEVIDSVLLELANGLAMFSEGAR